MSKTKGNVIDPLDIIQRFGTDATRFTLAAMAAPGTDIAFSESRTDGYRAFANKIWNAARFMFMNVDRIEQAGTWKQQEFLKSLDQSLAGFHPTTLEDHWILSRFHRVTKDVNEAWQTYRFHEAANRIYDFFWGDFCDWYIELVKPRLAPRTGLRAGIACGNLVSLFEASLRLLHPVMPFITEEIWHAVYDGNPPMKSIALAAYPQADEKQVDLAAETSMAIVAGFDRRSPQFARGIESRAEAKSSDSDFRPGCGDQVAAWTESRCHRAAGQCGRCNLCRELIGKGCGSPLHGAVRCPRRL